MTDVGNSILKEHVQDLLYSSDQLGLSAWEIGFLTDMNERRSFLSLSPAQKQKILDIAEKYDV